MNKFNSFLSVSLSQMTRLLMNEFMQNRLFPEKTQIE